MKKNNLLIFLLIFIAIFLIVDPALAGPGGYIAKGLFKTWWGKLLLVAISIVLLPLIIYVKMREAIAIRKNKKTLAKLGRINNEFQWLHLEKSVKNVFQRVWHAWTREDMEKVSDYVSNWYWQNQQLVILDRWKEENLQNICELRSVESIKPLYLEITDRENFEYSKIAFGISADIEDYLINRSTKTIVKGKSGFNIEEYVWIIQYVDGNWILDDIQEGSMSLAYAKLPNILPQKVISVA